MEEVIRENKTMRNLYKIPASGEWKIPVEAKDDGFPWLAIRIFTPRLKAVVEFFAQNEITYFFPVKYVDFEDRKGRIQHDLRPVVHNIIFIKKNVALKELKKVLEDCPYNLMVMKKEPERLDFYEISSKEMFEFMLMCNPEIELRKYISEEQALLKEGTEVEVHYGPLKGLTGKLVRQNKKYYLLKEVPGMGVMVKVSRWCCKPLKMD